MVGISRRNPNFQHDIYYHITADLSKLELLADIEDELHLHTIEQVILNAGILPQLGDLSEMLMVDIKKVMDVNVWSNKILIDMLVANQKQLKQVIAISSGAAISGARGWNVYALSKASLNMLVNLYAKEFTNIHFSAFAPGLVDTAMQNVICNRPHDEKYPVFDRLKTARGTVVMPEPCSIVPTFVKAFEKLLDYESGCFVDVRKMNL